MNKIILLYYIIVNRWINNIDMIPDLYVQLDRLGAVLICRINYQFMNSEINYSSSTT